MSILRSLHLPRPKRFLYFLPLSLGTTIISYTLLINKISGLYGLLALLTGASLSLPQLVMYIYSLLIAFLLATWLIPGISLKKPTEAVVFTWVFGVDSLVNAAFTGLFGAEWYLNGLGAQSYAHPVGSLAAGASVVGRNTTSAGIEGDQVAVMTSSTESTAAAGQLPAESVASITIIAVLWLIRVYFFLVVLAFSRAVVRGEEIDATTHKGGRYSGFRSPAQPQLMGVSAIEAEAGWKGRIGRVLVGVNRGYWEEGEGGKGVSEWMRLGDLEERGRGGRGSNGSSRSGSLRRD